MSMEHWDNLVVPKCTRSIERNTEVLCWKQLVTSLRLLTLVTLSFAPNKYDLQAPLDVAANSQSYGRIAIALPIKGRLAISMHNAVIAPLLGWNWIDEDTMTGAQPLPFFGETTAC